MGGWFVALGMIVLLAAWGAVTRNRREISALRSATVELRVDEFGVRRELADGRSEAVEWTDVVEVEVFGATRGPHAPSGGALVLYGSEGGCVVPLDQVHPSGVADGLSRLPGFSVSHFVRAIEHVEARPHHLETVWSKGPE
jgi:hypothetical protein